MTIEEMMKLMGEGATRESAQAMLDLIKKISSEAVATETQGLLDNKDKILTQMAKLKLNQFPEDIDLEAFNEFTNEKEEFAKKKKELADKELEDQGQWEALRIQLNETHTTAINTASEESGKEIAGLRKALDKELITNAAMKAIEKEKGNSLFLLPHLQNNIKTEKQEDGTYSVQVLDKEGKQRFADDATTPFTVGDLVAEFKANDSYAAAFPDQNGGGGGNPNAGGKGGSGINPWKTDTKNVTEQARITKENPTLAAQYKKAAGVQ